jgi:hypothetical protein
MRQQRVDRWRPSTGAPMHGVPDPDARAEVSPEQWYLGHAVILPGMRLLGCDRLILPESAQLVI